VSNESKTLAANGESNVLHGHDVLCFSHDWSGDPLSKTHLMRLVAANNRVLWVNSIGYRTPTASKADVSRAFKKLTAATSPLREVERNIFVLNPLAIPAYGNDKIRRLNRILLRLQVKRAMRQLRFKRPINWVFNPAAAVIARAFDEDLLIYHCVDEYTAFSGVASQHLAELEEQLLKKSDVVIVSADLLYQSKSKFNPNTFIVRHGVDYKHFSKALAEETQIPDEIKLLPHPIIGFFGLIADWVDVDLMAYVASKFPEGSLVVLGKSTTDVSVLERQPNAYLLGRKPYQNLPAYCKGFDVALMPFRINELTLNANPLKVREYLAAGLQVVSTPIPEVQVLGLCRIAGDKDDYVEQIIQALADPGPSRERSLAIQHESWEAKLKEISDYLGPLTKSAESSRFEM
jgi:glycosyltransferase involved in cell wall biosynthesis